MITRGEVATFLRALGLDPDAPCHLDIERTQVTVTPAGGDAAEVAIADAPAPDGMVRMRHPNLPQEVDVPAGSEGQWAMAGWGPAGDAPAAPEQPKQTIDQLVRDSTTPEQAWEKAKPEQAASGTDKTPPRSRRKAKGDD
jgi:hypothetical protein